MTPELLQRIDGIFQSALDLGPVQRRQFLAELHATDPELHFEVDSLLCAHDRAGAFIEVPVAEAAAALLGAAPVVTRVGTYTIGAPLGSGGMGEVYRAVDRMGRVVALKTLGPLYVHDPKHVSRFLQEARAVLALNHPNIVTVYDIGEADGVYYIASELIEGETLREAINNRAFTLDVLLDIAAQIATGIAAAHEKGIVHRDLKPENVMVRADGYVKVLDFGIAKLTETFDRSSDAAQTALTREGLVIGTVSYMSPEQARGANVDARSDVWSLGVMLYEMIARALPFAGDSPADVIGGILEREPAPLAKYVDAPPVELQAIVTRALAKAPRDRFQTMVEFIAALASLRQELTFAEKLQRLNVPNPDLTSQPPVSPPTVFVSQADVERTTGPQVGGRRGRHRILIGTLGAILMFSIASLVWFAREPRLLPSPTRSIAVLPFATMSDDTNLRHLSDALAEELVNDLTAERQLRVASRTSSSNRPANQGVSAFAEALRVSYVLEGSLRPTASGIRVTVQLIRGRDDVHLLSHAIDMASDGTEVSGAARQMAAQVFRYLDNDLDIARARTQTTNDEAFGYYEKVARFDPSGEHVDTGRVGQEQAFIYLDKAIALDPAFAEPYLQRALRVSWDQTGPLIDRYLQLQPDSAMGWTLRGMLQVSEGDLAAAETSYRHARKLNPDYPWPLSQLGLLAVRRGHLDEAANYLKQSTVNDHSRPSHYFYGEVLLNLNRFDEAEQEFEIALRVVPTDVEAMVARVLIAHLRGNDAEAKARFDTAWAQYGTTHVSQFIPVLPIVGHEQELRELMRGWDEATPGYAVLKFNSHLALHEYDAAIDWLLRSIDDGLTDYIPRFLRSGASLDGLRAHPRFSEVLARLDAAEVTH